MSELENGIDLTDDDESRQIEAERERTAKMLAVFERVVVEELSALVVGKPLGPETLDHMTRVANSVARKILGDWAAFVVIPIRAHGLVALSNRDASSDELVAVIGEMLDAYPMADTIELKNDMQALHPEEDMVDLFEAAMLKRGRTVPS